MFVWIPRYAYQVPERNAPGVTTPHTVNIRFLEGTTNRPRTGEPIRITRPDPEEGPEPGDWVVHPAFTFGPMEDGSYIELPGIWVAKYLTGLSGSTTNANSQLNSSIPANINRAIVQPGERAWRGITTSNMFTVARGFAPSNNIEGTSLLTRNRDWGAVAYLAHSRYGRNGTRISINNNGDHRTGFGGNTPTAAPSTGAATQAWNTAAGMLASTTGNVYGVYDMSGGAWDRVAAYLENGSTALTGLNNNVLRNAPERYKDVYRIGTTDTPENNWLANSNRFGNAVWETSSAGTGGSSSAIPGNSWFGNRSDFPSGASPMFDRGGREDAGDRGGPFNFGAGAGATSATVGFRIVILPITY